MGRSQPPPWRTVMTADGETNSMTSPNSNTSSLSTYRAVFSTTKIAWP